MAEKKRLRGSILAGSSFVTAIVLIVAVTGCTDIFSGTQDDTSSSGSYNSQGSTLVSSSGGFVEYGGTLDTQITLSEVPYTTDLNVEITGDERIGYWGIYDMTDHDDLSWHQGNMSISYADVTSSFDVGPSEKYPFTVTLQDITGNAVTANTTYEIEVGVLNKDGLVPNPYMFRVRVTVNP